ncbi:MAG: NmrA/HSCARG family protein [Chlamydiales bacterium]
MAKVATKAEILVCGATGQQGGAVSQSLLKEGVAFRALSRSLHKLNSLKELGVETIQGDLADKQTIVEALSGIEQAFLVTTPFEEGVEKEVEQGINFVQAAMKAGVKHLIFSSVASADKKTGIPHFESKWKIEQYMQKEGIAATILRPVFFMENFATPWFLPEIKQGKLKLPVSSEKKFQMVCLQVIGAFAAACFKRPSDFIGQIIELASDEMTLPQVMGKISSYSGKHIEYEELPYEEAEQKFGSDFAKMFKWFNDVGYSVDIEQLKQWKIPLTSFNTYLSEADWLKYV